MVASLLINNADAKRVLQSISAADLTGKGLAHVISVRLVAQALGDRWTEKRAGVWDFVDGAIRRRARGALAVQLNEVDFLVALPDGGPALAAARCLDIVREVMTHFLGRGDDAKFAVTPLRSLEDGGGDATGHATGLASTSGAVGAHPKRDGDDVPLLSPVQFEPTARPGRLGPYSEPDGPSWHRLPASAVEFNRRFTRLSSPNFPDPELLGRDGVPARLEPIWSLRHGAVSSFRLYQPLSPTSFGEDERRELDFTLLDQVVGPEGVGFLQQGAHLHLPVAWTTVLAQRQRLQYLNTVMTQREIVRKRVLLEIEGLEAGVLESRLAEVTHFLRPFFRMVLGSCGARALRGPVLRSCGLSGVAIDCERLALQPAHVLQSVENARRQTPVVVVHGMVESMLSEASLIQAGASHLSWRTRGVEASTAHDARAADRRELRRVAGLIQSEH